MAENVSRLTVTENNEPKADKTSKTTTCLTSYNRQIGSEDHQDGIDKELSENNCETVNEVTLNSRSCTACTDEDGAIDDGSVENNNKPILDQHNVKVTVKCLKERHKLTINANLAGDDILKLIASSVRIPTDKLKLVCKGKLVTSANIEEYIRDKAVFQAIGEVAESEEGLESGYIDCIMTRLGVERNQGIRALRDTGDIVDAILLLGNK